MRCIVAGNALSLPLDLDQVFDRYGELPVIAVNGASKHIKAFALYSQHPDRFLRHGWISGQLRKFGYDFTVHTNGWSDFDYIDELWPNIRNSGGSAWGARKLAVEFGYDEVILCGCPMIPGPYVGNHNLTGFMHKPDVVDELFSQIEKDTEWHEGCTSMSGRTKELLGC